MLRRRHAGHGGRRLQLADLGFWDRFQFWCGWRATDAAVGRRSRWRTFEAYLADYGQVREDVLAQRQRERPGWPVFAEYVWQAQQTGGDREAAIEAYRLAREAVVAGVGASRVVAQ